MLGNTTELPSKFTHAPMVMLADYARTMNMASQVVAKANAAMADTGDAAVVIDGIVDATLAQDAAYDISADTYLEEWATATSYTAAESCQHVVDDDGRKQWYQCIADHTSSAANKPGQPDHVNASWRTYWTESSNRALPARGDTVITTYSRIYLVLKKKTTGTLTTVLASANGLDAAVLAAGPQVPIFDPQACVAVAYILKNALTANDVWGTDDDSGECTIVQWVGPCLPSGIGLTDEIIGLQSS